MADTGGEEGEDEDWCLLSTVAWPLTAVSATAMPLLPLSAVPTCIASLSVGDSECAASGGGEESSIFSACCCSSMSRCWSSKPREESVEAGMESGGSVVVPLLWSVIRCTK